MKISKFALIVSLPLAFIACNKSEPAPTGDKPTAEATGAAAAVTPAAREEAKDLLANRCAACHGATGAGDGPAAGGLTPKPANFTDAAWQSAVKDDEIEKAIKFGGAAVGKSPMMPGNPDLADKDATVVALRELIRSLKK